MQVDASHGTLPHRMTLQKNSRHDNGLYAQPPIMPQEKLSNDEMITTESKDNTTTESESVSASLHEVIDNLDDEEPSNDQESIPYCVKTKPYYSINAKLNQREKTSVPVNVSVNKYLDKGYSEGIVDETSITEDQIAPLEDVKPPSAAWDANFKLLAASASGKTSQTYNKSNVTCFICGKQLSNQYNLRVHMETHSNSSYSCTSCSHVSRSRDALRKHVSYRHPVASSQKRPRYTSKPPLL
ncbi:unnamed protein product [Lasius platythorax]|uniref:C2H2-type domain-containing protein n=1 Tax=Lasius platythorax TaxID=488582 RepID=A0AAV2P229_9HYME